MAVAQRLLPSANSGFPAYHFDLGQFLIGCLVANLAPQRHPVLLRVWQNIDIRLTRRENS
jgi:hypothetical protein